MSEEVEEVSADVEAAQVQLADVLAELRTISARLDALERDRRGATATPRPGPVSPIRSTVGVGSTGPIRSSAAAMSASVRSACVISRTLPGHAAGQHPRVGEPAQRAAEVGDRDAARCWSRGRRTDQPRSRRPAASGRARAWSSASRSMRSSADQRRRGEHPALAHAAAEHLAQPPRLLARTPPTRPPRNRPGAPRPLLRQTCTVSTPTVSVAGGTPSATAACQSRAPSRCTRRPRGPGRGRDGGVLVRGGHGAARGVVGVLQAQQRGAQRVVRPGACRRRGGRRRGRPCPGPASCGSGRGMPPASHAAVPSSASSTCAPAGARNASPRVEVAHQRDEVAHRAARRPQRVVRAEQAGDPGLELAHRGVAVEDVVVDLGGGHRVAHLLGRAGDGVRTQVDRAVVGRSAGTSWVASGQSNHDGTVEACPPGSRIGHGTRPFG